ncbi:NAD(P)H-quinone oxidoreductase chain 4 [Medicago truncatula]|uniref:NAD(P)H-quinone oxidoreductase chain 4 n=1 Tax=Medicago truncatula TaxID=3880 RepID=G7I7E3_MEDTR|nr:NAD(P)H-quinone oxidoreductase chain 4 [Medicago truncatula]
MFQYGLGVGIYPCYPSGIRVLKSEEKKTQTNTQTQSKWEKVIRLSLVRTDTRRYEFCCHASCILPLVLHEMGAYGLVRINMELFSHAHSIFCPWLMILGSTQIIYAASTSFAIPMPKIFTIFTILSMTSFALSDMSGFVAELISFFLE